MLSDTMMLGGGRTAAFSIKNSLLFRGAQYLSRTPSSVGNRKTWTISCWVRRGAMGVRQCVFSVGNTFAVRFEADDTLRVDFDGATSGAKVTARLFRDPTAYLHILIACDTVQQSNRLRIFVNGLEETAFSTNNDVELNYDTVVNSITTHRIGAQNDGGVTYYFQGYLAEPVIVDGAALAPIAFGEVDPVTLNWRPKHPAVMAWGANGFYLGKPWDSADLGKDTSGRGNHWTPSGFSTTDALLDSPTNVYATWNPLTPSTGTTYSSGNLVAAGATDRGSLGTLGIWSGKYYFEGVFSVAGDLRSVIGIGCSSTPVVADTPSALTNIVGYTGDGNKHMDGARSAYGASFTTQTIGVALDADARTVTFYRDNVSQGVISLPAAMVAPFFPHYHFYTGSRAVTLNCGQRAFTYTPPDGYKPLCTANLPAPGPAAKQPWKYYSCQTVVHDGATTAVALGWDALATDWLVRIKSLSSGSWYWFDTKRGLDKYLLSDSTAAEGTNASMIIDRVAGGFSLGTGCTADSYLVEAWRVAPEAGFDIQVGTMGSNPTVVSHALGAKPAFFMAKNRQAAQNWNGWHKSLANETSAYLQLSTTAGAQTFVNMWNGITAASVGLIPEGPVTGGQSFVVYLWSEVPGFSKFGSYTGNGSADGPFNYCGFTPASFTVKSAGSSSQWPTINTAVVPYNVSSSRLYLNLSNANQSGFHDLDVNANGVKVRVAAADSGGNDFNTAGGTYIYAAFAAHPLGGKRVGPATAR